MTGGTRDTGDDDVTLASPAPLPHAPTVRETGGEATGPFGDDGMLDGRYRLVRSLGEGGMGQVFLVDDLLLRKHAALKTLIASWMDSDEELERFWREAAIAHTVHHPNVARTYDIGEQDGVHYLTMEALQGKTLMDRLRKGDLLSGDELREYFVPLCRGLRAAHRAGIIHRDLKPANIMLVRDERKAVIMDFGIAGTVDDPKQAPPTFETSADMSPWQVTSAGRGTPAYMAPEQWDEHSGDHRTDIYALGVIMYVSLTGKAPFGARTMEELAEKHRSAPPPNVSEQVKGVGKDVAKLITRCLAKSPDDRPADMDEVLAVLNAGRRRRRYVATLTATVIAAGLVALAGYGAIFTVTKSAVIQEVRPSTQRLARLVALDVDLADLAVIRKEADMARPEFKRVLATLQRYQAEDAQITYVYIMRRTAKDHVYHVVVDSDPEEEDDNGDGVIQPDEEGAPPGTEYAEYFPLMKKTLDTGKPQADEDFSMDQWGVSISGYAPMPGDVDKEYFVGVDVGNQLLVNLRHRLQVIFSLLAGLATLGYAIMWWPLPRGGTLMGRLIARDR